jgi:hypothetical protein
LISRHLSIPPSNPKTSGIHYSKLTHCPKEAGSNQTGIQRYLERRGTPAHRHDIQRVMRPFHSLDLVIQASWFYIGSIDIEQMAGLSQKSSPQLAA